MCPLGCVGVPWTLDIPTPFGLWVTLAVRANARDVIYLSTSIERLERGTYPRGAAGAAVLQRLSSRGHFSDSPVPWNSLSLSLSLPPGRGGSRLLLLHHRGSPASAEGAGLPLPQPGPPRQGLPPPPRPPPHPPSARAFCAGRVPGPGAPGRPGCGAAGAAVARPCAGWQPGRQPVRVGAHGLAAGGLCLGCAVAGLLPGRPRDQWDLDAHAAGCLQSCRRWSAAARPSPTSSVRPTPAPGEHGRTTKAPPERTARKCPSSRSRLSRPTTRRCRPLATASSD